MSILYCYICDVQIDTDTDAEHFDQHKDKGELPEALGQEETEDERLDRLAQEQENMEQRQHESNLYNQGHKP